ncbi:hypothetical protein JQS43_22190 [Natronosporangium hydrolyticum]|uniref:DUF1707 domain-containing protein n=1 Tax=Natronosporangium hydrolyticum TaxID=2811111 RepID=A0A895YI05_9ACTN|nr:hypothetical protein [Natronosporangium hydrolyticum]QSB14196.1 hypothetical protein JQS43_22190 [Natronosporangium hydrolyticum]
MARSLSGSDRIRNACKFLGTVLAATLAITIVAPSPASAETPQIGLDQSDRQQLHDFFAQYGVDPGTADTLIESLEAGEAWDSLTGASPVSTEIQRQENQVVDISTYEDGSIAVSVVPDLHPEVSATSGHATPQSVSGCTLRSTPSIDYYDQCLARVDLGVIMMGFYMDFQRVYLQGAQITRYWGHHHRVIGGALSSHRLEQWSPTQVRYSADVSLAFEGFPVGWTAWMQANVSMTHAWTTNN